MGTIHIFGGKKLCGQTTIQGSKNAVLPILAATLLIPGISVIENCPDITDVSLMIKLLQSVGCLVVREEHTVIVDASHIKGIKLPAEYVTKMRSSIMLMGSMLGRLREVFIDYPGGCVIGERPIDMHIHALRHLGIDFEKEENRLWAHTEKIIGNDVVLPFASVGATENVILAAVLAEGVTVLKNAAKEPEIIALCEFLNGAGAEIKGIGTDTIEITGVLDLQEGYYAVPSDRIVAGTYLLACAGCGGEIQLNHVNTTHLQSVYACLEKMGAVLEYDEHSIQMRMHQRLRMVPYVQTAVYPGFPTDLQSPLMAVLSIAEGTGIIEEAIFENRFHVVKELQAMGADIQTVGPYAKICGVECLHGKNVVAEELRGGAALVVAGLLAHGVTTVENRMFIDRGYEDICLDLKNLGAGINMK